MENNINNISTQKNNSGHKSFYHKKRHHPSQKNFEKATEAVSSVNVMQSQNNVAEQNIQKSTVFSKANSIPDMNNLLFDDIPVYDDTSAVGDELDRIIMAEKAANTNTPEVIPDIIPNGKAVIVGIRFHAGGKTYYFDPCHIPCKVGDFAILETARGIEFGEICIAPRLVDEKFIVSPLRPIIRVATEEDIKHNKENAEKEDEAFKVCVQKIMAHKLDMKLVKAQYTFDNSKLLFYFTSAGRVDFRELVKDLAGVFHIRIELRQIGIRDEARMLGGLGICGRPLCCSTFLSDFGQVSMKMAKEQNLSLNSTKISGCCGRLMCCLRYEYDVYADEIKKSPAIGSLVNTPDGAGVVTEILPLAREVKVNLRTQSDSAPKKYKREDISVLSRLQEDSSVDTMTEE